MQVDLEDRHQAAYRRVHQQAKIISHLIQNQIYQVWRELKNASMDGLSRSCAILSGGFFEDVRL